MTDWARRDDRYWAVSRSARVGAGSAPTGLGKGRDAFASRHTQRSGMSCHGSGSTLQRGAGQCS